MHKGDVVHIHTHTLTGILFIHEKEENFSICKNMNGSQGHHAEWNKPVIGGLILHDSAYVRCLISQTQKQKVEWWLPGTGERGMGNCCSMGYSSSHTG